MAILMAILMIATVFAAVSVSAGTGEKEEAQDAVSVSAGTGEKEEAQEQEVTNPTTGWPKYVHISGNVKGNTPDGHIGLGRLTVSCNGKSTRTSRSGSFDLIDVPAKFIPTYTVKVSGGFSNGGLWRGSSKTIIIISGTHYYGCDFVLTKLFDNTGTPASSTVKTIRAVFAALQWF